MKTIKIVSILILSMTITYCATDKKEKEILNSEKVTEVTNTKPAIATEMLLPESLPENINMYVIEREIPGAGDLTTEELEGISQVSCGVLKEMGSEIQWSHSYVTGDKIYCVYTAPNVEMVREHAKKGGFPANSVSKVATIISPATAE